LLKLENVIKVYTANENNVDALQEISLQVPSRIFLAIQGQSGSGKSTLLNILGCLDRPTSGTYTVDGADTGKLSDDGLASLRNQRFGFIFQSFNLLPRFNALENVMLPFLYSPSPPENPRAVAQQMLEKVGLGNRMHHLPGELSGGQQQRVAVARALVNKPGVILADEPTGALDSKSSREIVDLLAELNAEGKTVIIITHEADIASQCPYVLTLSDGRITDLKSPKNAKVSQKVVASL
jgi:putative ABC transport system ATP-binding protein